MRVDNVACACHRSNNHPCHLQRQEKVGPKPAILVRVVASYAEAIQARTTQDELGYDKEQPKLGLVDAAIQAGEPGRDGVRSYAGDEEANDGPDERTRVHVACRDLVEEQRRAQHNCGEHDAHEDGPANQRALDETGP